MKKTYGRLQGRVGIVTGGGTGICKELALGMAAEGANITIMDIRPLEESQVVADEIKALGVDAIAVQGDVSKYEDCVRAVEETVKAFGKLDMLVHGAAVMPGSKETPFKGVTPEEFKRVVDVNLNGTFNMDIAVIPEMLKAGGGDIVNILTAFIRMGQPNCPQYCASKSGAMMVTRAVAAEYGKDGIRCNGIAPGYTPDTEGSRHSRDGLWDDPEEANIVAGLPMRRKIMPEEYVGTTVFLLDREESFFITGQAIAVDGGMTMI